MTIDWKGFSGRTVFITGSRKNSGKTTFLKYALANMRRIGFAPAFMSIGVDGEQCDHLHGSLKPIITAEVGDFVATAERALEASDAGFSIIEVFPEESVFGRQVLARVVRPGCVELIGAAGNRQTGIIADRFRSETDADVVLIDGAVDRLTQIGAVSEAAYIAVHMVDQATLKSAVESMRLAVLLDGVPIADDECGGMMEIDGALTQSKAALIPDDWDGIILEDFTKVFLSRRDAAKLMGRKKLFFRKKLELMFFVVNLSGVSEEEFLAAFGQDAATERIVLNPFAAS